MALAPLCLLFAWSLVAFLKGKTVCAFVQVFGAGCLVIVVLTHVCEALHLLPFMQWGSPQSMGHYLDFSSAMLGLMLFPLGYLCTRFTHKR